MSPKDRRRQQHSCERARRKGRNRACLGVARFDLLSGRPSVGLWNGTARGYRQRHSAACPRLSPGRASGPARYASIAGGPKRLAPNGRSTIDDAMSSLYGAPTAAFGTALVRATSAMLEFIFSRGCLPIRLRHEGQSAKHRIEFHRAINTDPVGNEVRI